MRDRLEIIEDMNLQILDTKSPDIVSAIDIHYDIEISKP